MEYKLGLVSVSFRKNTVEEIVSAVKDAGLTCIEWGSDVHAPKDDIEKLNYIAKLGKENGIECSSYGTYFRLGVTPIEELEDYIDGAKILGTNILRLWCGDKCAEEYGEEEKQKLFAVCKKAALLAEQKGAILCMECHNGTYTNTEKSALELMRVVNSPNFLMYWQPQQFQSFEQNISYAQNISPYTKNIHVFNWNANNKYPLSKGIEIWKKYLSYFSTDKTLLLEFMPDDDINSLKTEFEALKQIIKD